MEFIIKLEIKKSAPVVKVQGRSEGEGLNRQALADAIRDTLLKFPEKSE